MNEKEIRRNNEQEIIDETRWLVEAWETGVISNEEFAEGLIKAAKQVKEVDAE